MPFAIMLAACLTACEKAPNGYEVDEDAVVLEAYGPNPVLRGSDLTFIGQNLDQISAVILPVDIEIPSSEFKEASANSFKVTVPVECEPGTVTLVYGGGTITAKTTLSYTEQFSISSVKPQDESLTVLSAGDSVVVEGEYLNNIVKFVFETGGAVAEGDLIGTHTRHQVCFAVPAGAMTGRIYGEDSNGNQAYSENELQIRQPVVTGVAPVKDVRPGDDVTISGELLDQIVSVAFTGAAEAILSEDFESRTATAITVAVPADAHDGTLTLVSAAQQEIVTAQAIEMKVPGSLSFASENVYKAGRQIVINGSDLDLVTSVTFTGGIAGTFTYADGALTVTIPDTATDGALTLGTAAGKSVSTSAVTLVKPVITGINPESVVAGETFVITGTDLDLAVDVTLGGQSCAFSVSEDGSSITVTTAATNATGKVAVSAANGYRAESSQELTVTYNSIVVVSELTRSVKPGEPVTMKGSKFNMIEAIYVGETKVTSYTSRTDTEIVFTMPEVAAASYNLRFVLTTGEEEECALPIEVTGLATIIPLWEGSWDAGNWNGNQDLAWGGFDWSTIDISQGTATLVAEVEQDASSTWWQFMLKTGTSWADLAGMQQIDMVQGQTVIEVNFTQTMLDDIRNNNGLIITGCYYTLKKLYISIE